MKTQVGMRGTKKVLTVREHAAVPVNETGFGISRLQLRELQTLQDRGTETLFKLTVHKGELAVKFQQFAGVVNFACGGTLEILPKLPGSEQTAPEARALLSHMVRFAAGAAVRVGQLGMLDTGATIVDAYIDVTQREIWKQLAQGQDRSFRPEQATDRTIRGRLSIPHQLSRFPGRHDKFIQIYPVLSSNTAINRALAAACKSMLFAARDRRLRIELNKLCLVFGELELGAIQTRDHEVQFGRANGRWKSAYTLCRQWLLRALPGTRAGNNALGPSVLFDMNKIFEEYLYRSLLEVAPSSVRRSVGGEAMFQDQFGNRLLLLRPDAEVGARNSKGFPRAIVCDAKWKVARSGSRWFLSPDDLRQVFAYAKILGFSRAGLIYPTLSSSPSSRSYLSRDQDPIELLVAELPIGDQHRLLREAILHDLVNDAPAVTRATTSFALASASVS